MSAPVHAVAALRAAGIDNPRLEARLLWEHAQKISSAIYGGGASQSEAEGEFAGLLARRLAHEPIAYILGEKEFWSLAFAVGPGVLIPRPETETLVETALAHVPDRGAPLHILDLGCGSGCILAALLSELPHAAGLGIEKSDPARGYAEANLERLGFTPRAKVVAGDWTAAEGGFDILVSNPPYIETGAVAALAPDIARFEPHAALDGGADGLDAYRMLAPLACTLLNPGGWAHFEIGMGQGASVWRLLTEAGLVEIAQKADLSGVVRVVSGRCPYSKP